MPEIILRDSKRRIYTKEVRGKLGIKKGGFVKTYIVDGKLVIKPIESVEERLRENLVKLSLREVERLSEEVQKEIGVYG